MRFDKAWIKQTAKDFITSSNARAWPFVSDELRDALVDQCVMNCVRMANAVDNCAPFTPGELVEFRAALVEVIETGVPMGNAGKRGLLFDRTIDARRDAAMSTGDDLGGKVER